MDLIYWRHPTIPGIKVEEISGGENLSPKIWKEMARQLYCENGREEYREIGHYSNGAPFLYGENTRISITHCPGLFAVATLPPTPDIELSEFNEKTAMGIDAERKDRVQVLKIRERFLSEQEQDLIAPDDVEKNIMAWTIKEAVYKACLYEGLDFRNNVVIKKLPLLGPPTTVFDPAEYKFPKGQKIPPEHFFGEVKVKMACHDDNVGSGTTDKGDMIFNVFSYLSDDFIITLAWTPACERFRKIQC